MLYDLIHQECKVHCILFDYGQRHAANELNFARFHCNRLRLIFSTVTLPQLKGSSLTDDDSKSMVVPGRNAILLSLAVNLAVAGGADAVTYACNKEDEANFPDCRMAFVQAYNILLLNAEIPVEICAPYIDKPKWWIAALGRELKVPLEQTWSCYKGGSEPCGVCEACKKRNEALVPRMGFEGVSREP